MVRILTKAVLLAGLASAAADAGQSNDDKVLSTRDFGSIRREVETLRGKTFLQTVPVYTVSEKELRAIAVRELDKDFPGQKLANYEELLAWLDMVPPRTSLKTVYGDYFVGQVAGLYDSDAKEMCLPSLSVGTNNLPRKAAEKKVEAVAGDDEDIVLAHEFTHALEDQYWPMDDPRDLDFTVSTDRGTAHDFVLEGSATRQMIEVIPAQWSSGSPGSYFLLWDMIHSGLGELALNYALGSVWKSSDALAAGVPDALARSETMAYSFGYSFCTRVMRDWSLDGLDYVYNHPPVSSAQVMHPKKYWEWRDFPVQINLPETLPGGWKQLSIDSLGEAGMVALLGSQCNSPSDGQFFARGWDGDHVALFEGPAGRRLFVWASSWGSTNAAGRYASVWAKERKTFHDAAVTGKTGNRIEWESPEGRFGLIRRDGNHVIVLETNQREALQAADAFARQVSFIEPPEDAIRAATNSLLRRFNPIWSWQLDGDYTVTRSLAGLLSRHDRNSVGAADRFLLGLLAESRRTASFRKWEVGWGLLARHESETRRGFTSTTWLPWGVLASHSAARLPQSPDKTIVSTTVIWGLGAGVTADGAGGHSVHLLPFGLLLRRTTGPGRSSIHILGTGFSQQEATDHAPSTTRVRLLGIPIWTSHSASFKHE
jgi:hypothetical protein